MLNESILSTIPPNQAVGYIISDYIYELMIHFNPLLVFFAIIGIFTILRAAFDVGIRTFTMILKLFVITPIIFIAAVLDIRKHPEKKRELTDIIRYIKTNPNVLYGAILWFIVFTALIVAIYLLNSGMNPIESFVSNTVNGMNDTTIAVEIR